MGGLSKQLVPYVLCVAILTGGVYVLYRTLVGTFVKEFPDPGHVLRDVTGIAIPYRHEHIVEAVD